MRHLPLYLSLSLHLSLYLCVSFPRSCWQLLPSFPPVFPSVVIPLTLQENAAFMALAQIFAYHKENHHQQPRWRRSAGSSSLLCARKWRTAVGHDVLAPLLLLFLLLIAFPLLLLLLLFVSLVVAVKN